MITYQDIKAKQQLATERKHAYLQEVCYLAKKLIDIYSSSLKLPDAHWCDAVGDKHPYVYIANGNKHCSPADFVTGPDNVAYFDLYTVTDDDPHHPETEKVRILINRTDCDTFDITVAGYRIETFPSVDTDEKISELSEFIKNNIMMSLNNTLCLGQKIKEPGYLWD